MARARRGIRADLGRDPVDAVARSRQTAPDPRAEVERLAAELLARYGDRAEEVAFAKRGAIPMSTSRASGDACGRSSSVTAQLAPWPRIGAQTPSAAASGLALAWRWLALNYSQLRTISARSAILSGRQRMRLAVTSSRPSQAASPMCPIFRARRPDISGCRQYRVNRPESDRSSR
jgi:hypothetical protein